MKYLVILLCFFAPALAKTYHFVSINHLIEQEVGRLVLSEVYRQLGVEITITPLPGKRAQYEASTGMKDGEIMRIHSYGREAPDTIRVPTPYYYLETMVFTKKNSGIKILTAADLKNYHVVKVRGVKHTENITQGMNKVVDADNTAQMFKLLQDGLADIALTNKMDGLVVLRSLNMTDIAAHEQSLDKLELYHYVYKTHSHLVPIVNQKLQQMTKTGELKKLVEQAELTIFNKRIEYVPFVD